MKNEIRIEKFKEKANKKHNNKYDYSKVNFNNGNKVCIICHEKDENGIEHGEFFQDYILHVRGNGCPKCANEKRRRFKNLTKEEFIEKAKKIHGDKYDYSKINYVNVNTKICIVCPTHGEFWMLPTNHIYLQKQGCPKCANRGLTTEEIIHKFREIHGDKYDYSKVIYDKMHNKVCIVCPKHGEFWQTPSKHLKGQGCPKCGLESRIKKRTKSTEQFIKEAKAIHGDKYDYSKVEYKGAFKKVCIICPKHGEFWQRAFDHIHNHGCSKCCESRLEKEIELFLKENNIEYIEQCNKTTFNWLNKQSLDFYLPKYNIAIECQGEQHAEPVEHFGGESEFKLIKERDDRKLKSCEENGIKIIYYSNIVHEGWLNDKDELLKILKA